MIPLLEDPALIADRLESTPGAENLDAGTLQVVEESATMPFMQDLSSEPSYVALHHLQQGISLRYLRLRTRL